MAFIPEMRRGTRRFIVVLPMSILLMFFWVLVQRLMPTRFWDALVRQRMIGR